MSPWLGPPSSMHCARPHQLPSPTQPNTPPPSPAPDLRRAAAAAAAAAATAGTLGLPRVRAERLEEEGGPRSWEGISGSSSSNSSSSSSGCCWAGRLPACCLAACRPPGTSLPRDAGRGLGDADSSAPAAAAAASAPVEWRRLAGGEAAEGMGFPAAAACLIPCAAGGSGSRALYVRSSHRPRPLPLYGAGI